MRGYPKHIATKQDFENLLKMPEFAKRALADMEKLAAIDDSKVTRAVRLVDEKDPMGEWVTEEIDNPNPAWKVMGFESKDALKAQVATNTEKISTQELQVEALEVLSVGVVEEKPIA